MTDDEYRELGQAALEALWYLLDATEPGTGLYLHTTYATLKKAVISGGTTRTIQTTRERTPDWVSAFTVAERAREILNVAAEHRLTTGEIADRVSEKHKPEILVSPGDIRNA